MAVDLATDTVVTVLHSKHAHTWRRRDNDLQDIDWSCDPLQLAARTRVDDWGNMLSDDNCSSGENEDSSLPPRDHTQYDWGEMSSDDRSSGENEGIDDGAGRVWDLLDGERERDAETPADVGSDGGESSCDI